MIVKKRLNGLLRIGLDLYIELFYRLSSSRHRLHKKSNPGVVVSMTSYPTRIKHSWLSLESLFRQDFDDYHVVLVLAKSQFPGGKVPRRIRSLVLRGLEIIWVDRDGRSFDHLWPAYLRYPASRIISVDDDKFFPPDLVSKLMDESDNRPHTIVGWRGWEMKLVGSELRFGEGWIRATRESPSEVLFMPPGNGSLYPPHSLPEVTGDYETREKVCPDADDVWYWAMARLKGSPSFCVGESNHRPVWKQTRTDSLASVQPGPREFSAVIRHFDLWAALERELAAHKNRKR